MKICHKLDSTYEVRILQFVFGGSLFSWFFSFFNFFFGIVFLFLSGVFASVGLDEFLQRVKITAAGVVDDSAFTFGKVFEVWETADLNTVEFVGSSVGFGDDDVVTVGKSFTELVPDGGERFAVTTPWGIRNLEKK